MVNFGDRPEEFMDEQKAFEQSFAGAFHVSKDEFAGNSFEYYNPMTRVNKKFEAYKKHKELAKQKVAELQKNNNDMGFLYKSGSSINTQTGGAGTAGTAMVPIWVDPTIVDRTVRETPFRNMVARRAVRGLTYDYVPLKSKGGAVWAGEGAAIADQVDVYDRESVDIKFLYAKGRITGPSIAAMAGFIDPTNLDQSVKVTSIYEAEEDALINGNSSTSIYEPDGMITQITTNTTDLSTTLPTLADLRAEYTTSYNSNGNVTVAITDAATHNYIKGLLLTIQRQVENPSESVMGFGIPGAFEFDDVMYIKDKFMPRTSGSKRILFLDMRYIFLAVLQELTYEEKASENDTYPYMLKEYLAVVNTFEASCTQMYGIK